MYASSEDSWLLLLMKGLDACFRRPCLGLTDVGTGAGACGSEPYLRGHSTESGQYFVSLISILFVWEFLVESASGLFIAIN